MYFLRVFSGYSICFELEGRYNCPLADWPVDLKKIKKLPVKSYFFLRFDKQLYLHLCIILNNHYYNHYFHAGTPEGTRGW